MNYITSVSKIKYAFRLKKSTNFSGLLPILQFLERMKIEQTFRDFDCLKKYNAKYPLSKIFIYLVIGWLSNCSRLSHFRTLQDDPLILAFMGEKCPHYTLLNKDLLRLEKLEGADLEFKERMMDLIEPWLDKELILDFDSTVETVYGGQEKAGVGVNPYKPGRKSYHPLLVFEGKSRLCLNARLREGNSHSSQGVLGFAKETYQLLSPHYPIRYARFDKGFGGEDFYSYWENGGIGYTGKLRWTSRLKKRVENDDSPWIRYVDDELTVIEGKAVDYQASSWKKPRRVAVIRKADKYEESQLQACDFLWKYEAIVTNMDWEPIDIWRFYNQRACMENYIKESKYGFSMGKISTHSFDANQMDLLIKLLAYNLFEIFKKEHCPPAYRSYTIRRFRREFIYAAGVLVYHSRSVILNICETYAHKKAFRQMIQSVRLID
ncbi:IS1380 family transposase [Heyndrickxia coagulans]|uniref:IS1380 family transposase n=1 Tax=Heyndrickxia coagulans TaxID=1398 RepID=UPI002E1F28E9|nr:IS1380 family transposase [Heyndrickxia coagulans]MED4346474.1 IS1380 family transposase [Heyndrickxia coagulans]